MEKENCVTVVTLFFFTTKVFKSIQNTETNTKNKTLIT